MVKIPNKDDSRERKEKENKKGERGMRKWGAEPIFIFGH